jgi:hypothetical protein
MSNPITRQKSKHRKILKRLVKDNGFTLDGVRYAIISLPAVPEGGTLDIGPIKMRVNPARPQDK